LWTIKKVKVHKSKDWTWASRL